MVIQVERIDLTLTDTNTTAVADTTGGQTLAQCVPFSTRYYDNGENAGDDFPAAFVDVEMYNNGGTAAVRVTRGLGEEIVYVVVYVVEFGADVTVQSGSVSGVGTTGTDVTVDAVDQAKTFAFFYYQRVNDGDVDAHDSASVRWYFTSNTNLRLNRSATADGTFSGHWYVVEDANGSYWDVQAGTIEMGGAETSDTDTIDAVTAAKTFVVASQEHTQADDDSDSGTCRVDLEDTTTVRALRQTAQDTLTVSYFAVEFDAGADANVYRGLMSFVTSDDQDTAAHTAVDPNLSVAHSPIKYSGEGSGYDTGSSDNVDHQIKVIINATDNGVVADRKSYGNASNDYAWETIEFEEYSAPAPVSVTPGLCEVAITGYEPTAPTTAHVSATPGLSQVVLAGFEPTIFISDHQQVEPGLCEIALTGFEPTITITEHVFATPGVSEVALTGFEPTAVVTEHVYAAPGVSQVTITGYEPTAVATAHVSAAPGVSEVVITGYEPIINTTLGVTVWPGTCEIVITGYPPTVVATEIEKAPSRYFRERIRGGG